jgi:hypothetical protein
MRRWLSMLFLTVALPVSATPCTGIDRTLTAAQKHTWAQAIATQMNLPSVDVLQVFRDGSWRVIYIDTHRSDNGFLFYRDDPSRSHYVTVWAGMAQANEESSIEQWVHANVPGIPSALAQCFAWHVTQDRGG